jgi:PAS domain S-box-containing protein
MLKIQKDNKQLTSLRQLQLTPVSTSEPYDLREFILNSPDAFFSEINNKLFVIGHNIQPSEAAQVATDFLALDRQGNAVVGVIERTGETSPLVRAITCAGLVSAWNSSSFLRLIPEGRRAALADFLEVGPDGINQRQRVVFIAESYDFESLTATTWLTSRGIDILSVRVSRANAFQTDGEYLWCSEVATPESAHKPLLLREGAAGFEVTFGDGPEVSQAAADQLGAETQRRKELEQELRASEERYRTLAKLSPVGIFHTDAEGNLTYVNARWCDMAGLAPEEAQGQGWARGLHSDDRDRVLSNWQETVEQGLPFKAEFRFQRPDGGTSWVLGEAAVQKDEGAKVTGYVGTVTELHRVDAARGGPMAAGSRF